VLLSVYDIKATVSFDTFDDAMKKLEQGNLDAVMFVGGRRSPLSASWTARFILSVCRPNPALEQIYARTSLGKSQYPWSATDTETYAVPASIMGWTSGKETTQRRCKIWFWPSKTRRSA